jgi:type I restriction enzyme S subunit
MSLPRYPEYKDSGVAWLGPVPAHWQVLALSRVLQVPVTDGPHSTPTFCDEGIPFLSVDGIQDGELVFEGCRFISHNDHLEFSRKAAPRANDILMGKAASIGKIARVKTNEEFSIWSPLALIRVSDESCLPAFAEYALKSSEVQAQVTTLANSNTQLNVGMKDIPKLRFGLPTLSEQTAIATFLDHETGKIDVLIAEQEKLLTLLAEKSQATISHAVTKGLDPNAPMKDSGVAWLGEVPRHWRTCPLKLLGRIGNGSTPSRDNPDYWAEEGFPWLNSSVVNHDEVTEAQQFVTPLALKECHLPIVVPPALLVGITGQGKTRGMATRLAFTATVNQHLAYIKPDESTLTSPYLLSVLESAYKHLRTESDGAGSTKGAITCEQLGRLRIPLPPIAEQHAISAFLDTETTKLDSLKLESERAIALLKERRAALISAAVTGKIDVRREAAQPIVTPCL